MNKLQFMGKNIENIEEQDFMEQPPPQQQQQVFDYKSFMSCLSNTLKKEDETLDSTIFDAIMNLEPDAFSTGVLNNEQDLNSETINTQKILNQLISSTSGGAAILQETDVSEITNEQIDMLLQSSNLLNSATDCNNNTTTNTSRSSSTSGFEEQILRTKTTTTTTTMTTRKSARACKRSRYAYENDYTYDYNTTQDGIDDSNTNSDNENENDDDSDTNDSSSSNSNIKRKSVTTSRGRTVKVPSNLDLESSTTISRRQSARRRRVESTDSNKKESNKEAATRYRIKKLSEKDQLFETRVYLEKQNDDTKKHIDRVQTEINYLKNLLCQVLLTKGILS